MVTRLAWEIYVKPRSVRPIRRGRSPKSVPTSPHLMSLAISQQGWQTPFDPSVCARRASPHLGPV